jgi:hypothetical protein
MNESAFDQKPLAYFCACMDGKMRSCNNHLTPVRNQYLKRYKTYSILNFGLQKLRLVVKMTEFLDVALQMDLYCHKVHFVPKGIIVAFVVQTYIHTVLAYLKGWWGGGGDRSFQLWEQIFWGDGNF